MNSLLKHSLVLMRPHQYVKNIFIFLPLFFSGEFASLDSLFITGLTFGVFCLVTSSIYIFNDYCDIQSDKNHPTKQHRPLASASVSKKQAIILILSLLIIAGFGILWIPLESFGIMLVYIMLNIVYSLKLKHIAIIDVMVIAIGFVLRLFIGALATGIPLSVWIVMMTFLLALFLALAKRRDDVLIYNTSGQKMREVIDGYNLQFVDVSMSIMASVVIVAYAIYVTSPEVVAAHQENVLYLTLVFVVMGILRYLQIAFVLKDSGSPTHIVFKDRFLQLVLISWSFCFALILYL